MGKRVLKWVTVLVLCIGMLAAPRSAYAAEQELVPGENISSAAGMAYDQEYFSTRRYSEEYLQFTTTGGHGYWILKRIRLTM